MTTMNADSQPRYLTKEEIDDILDDLPPVISPIKEIAEVVSGNIKDVLRKQISTYKLHPSKIEEYKRIQKEQFMTSVVDPGASAGITCSESIGGPATQMNLNTFHLAGSLGNASMGVEALKEVINARIERRQEMTTIHFKDKNLTMSEAFVVRNGLMCVTLNDIVKSKEYIHIDDNSVENMLSYGYWYSLYDDCFNFFKPGVVPNRIFLRLKLDVQLLYNYKITTQDVVAVINKFSQYGGKTGSFTVTRCIPSPTCEGIIDVLPDDRQMITVLDASTKKENIKSMVDNVLKTDVYISPALMFFQHVFEPHMPEMVIRGVKNLGDIIPVAVNTTSLILGEQYLGKQQGNNKWRLWLDSVKLRLSGITLSRLLVCLLYCNMKVVKVNMIKNYIDIIFNLNDESVLVKDLNIDNQVAKVALSNFIRKMKSKGINMHHIKTYCMDDINDKTKEEITIKKDEDITPTSIINNYIEAAEKGEKEHIKNKTDDLLHKKSGFITLDPSLNHSYASTERGKRDIMLVRLCKYVYGTAMGSNFKETLASPIVNRKLTLCNNYHKIADALGIEAARSFIIRELYEIISMNGLYINTRHIVLIVDFMVNQGIIIPITSKAVARQNVGPLARSTFYYAMNSLLSAGAFGKRENTKSTSTSIFLGKRCVLGTGSFDVKNNPYKIAALYKNKKAKIAIEQDANIDDELIALESITFADDKYIMESVSEEMGKNMITSSALNEYGLQVMLPEEKQAIIANVGPKGPVPLPVVYEKFVHVQWIKDLFDSNTPSSSIRVQTVDDTVKEVQPTRFNVRALLQMARSTQNGEVPIVPVDIVDLTGYVRK